MLIRALAADAAIGCPTRRCCSSATVRCGSDWSGSRRELGVAEDVVFTGPPWAELPAVLRGRGRLRDADAAPGKAGFEVEGLGIVYLEASATGLPVVAGDSGGAPDAVLDGETGAVVDGTRPEPVAEAVSQLLLDPEGPVRRGRRSRLGGVELAVGPARRATARPARGPGELISSRRASAMITVGAGVRNVDPDDVPMHPPFGANALASITPWPSSTSDFAKRAKRSMPDEDGGHALADALKLQQNTQQRAAAEARGVGGGARDRSSTSTSGRSSSPRVAVCSRPSSLSRQVRR